GREGEREPLQYHGKRYFGLAQREVVSRTNVRPHPEGHERSRVVVRSFHNSFRKSIRLEKIHVFSPYIGVMVDRHERYVKLYPR
ncbi:hypothetical protein LINGRAHAP2_LOCUS18356, partial [Linum grandiflorum]